MKSYSRVTVASRTAIDHDSDGEPIYVESEVTQSTLGDVDLGSNIAAALREEGRPLAILAEAVGYVDGDDGGSWPELARVRAVEDEFAETARRVVAAWKEFDASGARLVGGIKTP